MAGAAGGEDKDCRDGTWSSSSVDLICKWAGSMIGGKNDRASVHNVSGLLALVSQARPHIYLGHRSVCHHVLCRVSGGVGDVLSEA